MLVKFYGELKKYPDIVIEKSTLKEILSILNLHYKQECLQEIMNNQYFYYVSNAEETEGILLTEETIFSDLTGFDILHIIPPVEGEIPLAAAPLLAGMLTSAFGLGASSMFIAQTLIVLANMAISMGLSMAMQALSPTPEFTKDPATSQKAGTLFAGAPIIKEQGGSVPLLFGNPYFGGVLISSGVSNE